jgi:hypothetical protein
MTPAVIAFLWGTMCVAVLAVGDLLFSPRHTVKTMENLVAGATVTFISLAACD